MGASPETPESSSTPPDLEVQASYRRDPVAMSKMLGLSLLGIAGVPAILWVRPSLTEAISAGRGNAALHVPSVENLLLYAAAFALGLLGLVGIVALIWGVIRGVVMATCPACGATVVVGGERRVECTGCRRMLNALPPKSA